MSCTPLTVAVFCPRSGPEPLSGVRTLAHPAPPAFVNKALLALSHIVSCLSTVCLSAEGLGQRLWGLDRLKAGLARGSRTGPVCVQLPGLRSATCLRSFGLPDDDVTRMFKLPFSPLGPRSCTDPASSSSLCASMSAAQGQGDPRAAGSRSNSLTASIVSVGTVRGSGEPCGHCCGRALSPGGRPWTWS